jgi:hypothetical protein
MKRILTILMLGLLGACAGPEQHSTARAPHPQPSSTRLPEAMRSTPPECMTCAADVRRRLANCGSASSSCMSGCSGDAMKIAICQSNCQGIYASCAAYASVPNDCPAYCAL